MGELAFDLGRRRVLAAIGGGLSLSTPHLKSRRGESKQEVPQKARRRLVEAYGTREAEAIIEIVREHIRDKEAGLLTEDEAYERITDEVLSDTRTTGITRDLQETLSDSPDVDRFIFATEQGTLEVTGDVSLSGSLADALEGRDVEGIIPIDQFENELFEQNGHGLRLPFAETGKAASGAAQTVATVRYPECDTGSCQRIPDRVGLLSHVVFYGNAESSVSLYQTYVPPSTGEYEVEVDYSHLGNSVGADIEYRLFVRTVGDFRWETIREPSGSVDGDETRSEIFFLESGVEYDVGFKVSATAATAGGIGFADFYHYQPDGRRRHIEPESLTIVER